MSQMRTLEIEHVAFEWKCGKSFIRIKGNGHVADVPLEKFLVEVCGCDEREAWAKVHHASPRSFGIEPSDVVKFIHANNWLVEKISKKAS